MLASSMRAAADEARRFLERVKAAEDNVRPESDHMEPGAPVAALRRSSLDLTRALARMRQS